MGLTDGRVTRVTGALVEIDGLADVAMGELVLLGDRAIPAEVVAIRGSAVSTQAYEYVGGLVVGESVVPSGRPLSARLGPHLLGGVFDGLLRPLTGAPVWLATGATAAERATEWAWQPSAQPGTVVTPGAQLGTLPQITGVPYRVLVPPGVSGPIDGIAPAGRYPANHTVSTVDGHAVAINEEWPMRRARPVRERLVATEPLLTGQRVLDAVFPLARGSSAAVPGGFGTGKTLLLQQIAKWCTADVIVYVGCGERGNEMADVLSELAELADPRTGRRLSERTVIIANTSNMPMMARETSIYAGVTVAEFFRDMGHDAVVIADSTSRWAEALREFASRSGALPAEEGYPATLPSALAAFYERAGRVVTLGGGTASVTIIGAVSPPGGDITEPVTAQTQRFVRNLWTLDRDLAYARHYPAVGWAGSFSRDAETLGGWYARSGNPDWAARRARIAALLAEADRLTDLAELIGVGSLPDRERIVLFAGRLIREAVLQQSAVIANEAHCTAAKTTALLDAVLTVIERCESLADKGVEAAAIERLDFSPLLRAAAETPPEDTTEIAERRGRMLATLAELS